MFEGWVDQPMVAMKGGEIEEGGGTLLYMAASLLLVGAPYVYFGGSCSPPVAVRGPASVRRLVAYAAPLAERPALGRRV